MKLSQAVKMPKKKSKNRKTMFFVEEELMKANSYNQAIEEISSKNFDPRDCVEVDAKAMFKLIAKREFFMARYSDDEIFELIKHLASNLKAWLKEKT